MGSDDELDSLVKALSRVKKDADEAPRFPSIIPAPEGREQVRFFFWMLGGLMSLVGTIIVATTVVVGYRNDTHENRRDIQMLMDRTAPLVSYDFKDLGSTVVEMKAQREYGISNYDYYISKHGHPPARLGEKP
jgi:hypothetical protein